MSDPTVALIAALVQGDRWLSADACAVYLGLWPFKKSGREAWAVAVATPGFPSPVNGQWDREAVDAWALSQRETSVPRQTSLYRHFDAEGRLLYVGVSLNAVNRLAQHRNQASWYPQIASITIQPFASRAQALAAEAKAVRAERPMFNVVWNRRA